MTERKFVPKVVDLINRFQLEQGGHDSPRSRNMLNPKEILDHNNKVCIMELTGVLQGVGVTTSVPCVSEVLTSVMIDLNDSLTDGDQQALVEVIPYILHTRPVGELSRGAKIEYYEVEDERREILAGLVSEHAELLDDDGEYVVPKDQLPEVIEKIKEAADLRRWEEVQDDIVVA